MNTKHDFHNPDNLTPEQIGEGYRLLLKSEVKYRDPQKDIHRWDEFEDKWDDDGWGGWGEGETYRVPLATWPLLPPVETFPAAMESVTKQESAPTDNDVWNSLLATNAQLGRKVAELEKLLEDSNSIKQAALEGVRMWSARSNQNADDLDAREAKIEDLQSKLTAAEARLKQLEWVPFSERKPTREDGDHNGEVIVTDGKVAYRAFYQTATSATHWRPFAPPAPIDTDRVEFEKWWERSGFDRVMDTGTAYQCWKAERAKEADK